MPEIEKDFQNDENEKTNLAQLRGRAESDHRSWRGDSVGDTGSGIEPAGVAARPAETEVSNDQIGEAHSGKIVDGDSGHRRAGDDARVPEPQSAAAEHVSRQSVGTGEPVGVQPDAQASLRASSRVAAYVQPDAQLEKSKNVQPDAHSGKSKKKSRIKPPTISGHGWKPSGLTGWELYRRKPAISVKGKRSSKQFYVAYYSQKAIERLHDAKRKKASNA